MIFDKCDKCDFEQTAFSLDLAYYSLQNIYKCYHVIFDKKSGSTKRIRNYNPAHKMVETFENPWVLLIHLSQPGLIIDGITAHVEDFHAVKALS